MPKFIFALYEKIFNGHFKAKKKPLRVKRL